MKLFKNLFLRSRLKSVKLLNTKPFSFNGNQFLARIIDVYDGDSITALIYFNKEFVTIKCRLYGIDTAEIRTKDENEKKFAIETKHYLENIILNEIININCYTFDNFGRVLVDIIKDGQNINDLLVNKGYAYRYDGKTKRKFSDWFKNFYFLD